MSIRIQKEQLRRTFIELIKINSFYPDDTPAQDYVRRRLDHPQISCVKDSFGNLIAALPGDTGKPAVMLNTHIDIPEDTPKVDYKETADGVEGTGRTILGADPKTGVAVLVELALALAADDPQSHAPVDFVFTRGEEIGLVGARELDMSKVRAKTGLVIDEDGPASVVVTNAPAKVKFEGTFVGATAHSRDPHHGVNALLMAANAISLVGLGHTNQSKEVIWNLGLLQAGTAVNSVPGRATFSAELRSLDGGLLQAEARRIYDVFDTVATKAGGSLDATLETLYEAYHVTDDDPLLTTMNTVYKSLGLTPSYIETLGASDANIFNARGIHCTAIGSGYYNAHQYTERADVNDMHELAVVLDRFVRI